MMNRPFRRYALIASAALAAFACGAQPDTPDTSDATKWVEPPHAIILISLDTLRADYLGAYGYETYPTSPFLDSFALDNVLFERSFVVEPRTLTSHMSVMTGLYPQHHGVIDTTVLPDDIPTLAALLRDAGYRTQAFTDGGYMNRQWGLDRGFDEYVVNEDDGFQKILPNAVEWLANNDADKFFLFLHTYDVHNTGTDPLYVSPAPTAGMFSASIGSQLNTTTRRKFKKRLASKRGKLDDVDRDYLRATYAEGVRYVDNMLKEFFATLKQEGLYEDALIVVWSDHGEGLYDHGDWSHSEVFDHTVRVPLIVKIPGQDPGRALAGTRIRSVVSSVDIAPTILDLVGTDIPSSMDGSSLLPLLENDTRDEAAFSIRTKSDRRLFSIRTMDHRYIVDEKAGQAYFFDLNADANEQNNLSPSGSEAEAELSERLTRWIAEHDRARAAGGHDGENPLDPEISEKLRALGYVD